MLRRSLAPGFGARLPPVRRTGWGRAWHAAKVSAERAVWSGRAAWRVGSWCVRHPVLAVVSLTLLCCSLRWGPLPVATVTAGSAGVGCIGVWCWGRAYPDAYTRWVHVPARSWWRRLWVYRRHLQPACATANLSITKGEHEHLPRLGRVRSGASFDTVRLRMLPGQTPEVWSKAGEQLAQTFGVLAARAYSVPGRPHSVELRCLVRDPLVRPVTFGNLDAGGDSGRPVVGPLTSGINANALQAMKGRVRIKADEQTSPAVGSLQPGCADLKDKAAVTSAKVSPKSVDLSAVPVGLREDGGMLTLPANRHLLIAGESGAGKSSALWALVAGVAPMVAAGTLKLIAVDPKGIELAAGAPLWAGHCQTGKPEDAARFLEHTVTLMHERKARLQGGSRKLEGFTVDEPAYAVIVDELAALTAWVGDAKLRRRLADATGLIQSQGRALGFWLWGASQLAQKEVLGVTRDLSQVRLALRTADAEQVDMILGRGARARGALADRINPATPGVCYTVEDGQPEPVRGRIAHVTDQDIARIAAQYRRPVTRARGAA